MTEKISGSRIPLWIRGTRIESRGRLNRDLRADVCVVGGGIAGLTTAYHLLMEGKTVVLLEDGTIGSGETGRTSAHLSNALDDRYFALERLHGEAGARLAAESHAFAIDDIERIARENAIVCGFRRVPGYLFKDQPEASRQLEKEFDAGRRAGLEISWTDRAPFTNFDTGRCLLFPNQAEFHPMKYLAGLTLAVNKWGGQIFTDTHVVSVEGGTPARVTTADGRVVTAGAVVVATNTPINDRFAVHTKQAAYRSYVLGILTGKNVVPHALYWDTGDPYHYIRVAENPNDADTEILLIGGEDEKTGQTSDGEGPFEKLERWTRERFPGMGAVQFRWSGQILEPVDGIAFIGKDPGGEENVFIATGDSGNGLTHGTLGARLNADLILGNENPWAALYDPSRATLGSIRTFLRENLNAAAQYADWVTPGDAGDVDAIPPGKGAVIRRGLKKVAIYKGRDGRVSECSAVCPHLNAIVRWNDQEGSWDCPAHGSRFATDGHVLNGPAVSNLSPIEEESKTQG